VLGVTVDNFHFALWMSNPLCAVEVPIVKGDNVGGLEKVKQELR